MSKDMIDLPLTSLQFVLASELARKGVKEFVGEVMDVQIKKDRHGRPTLTLYVHTDQYGRIVISYSPLYTNIVVSNLTAMGFKKIGDIIGRKFKFQIYQETKRRPDHTNPYPRFVPVELVE